MDKSGKFWHCVYTIKIEAARCINPSFSPNAQNSPSVHATYKDTRKVVGTNNGGKSLRAAKERFFKKPSVLIINNFMPCFSFLLIKYVTYIFLDPKPLYQPFANSL